MISITLREYVRFAEVLGAIHPKPVVCLDIVIEPRPEWPVYSLVHVVATFEHEDRLWSLSERIGEILTGGLVGNPTHEPSRRVWQSAEARCSSLERNFRDMQAGVIRGARMEALP